MQTGVSGWGLLWLRLNCRPQFFLHDEDESNHRRNEWNCYDEGTDDPCDVTQECRAQNRDVFECAADDPVKKQPKRDVAEAKYCRDRIGEEARTIQPNSVIEGTGLRGQVAGNKRQDRCDCKKCPDEDEARDCDSPEKPWIPAVQLEMKEVPGKETPSYKCKDECKKN